MKILGTDPKVFATKTFIVGVMTPHGREYPTPSAACFERMLEKARPGLGVATLESGSAPNGRWRSFDVLVDVEEAKELRNALRLIEEQNRDYRFTVVAPWGF